MITELAVPVGIGKFNGGWSKVDTRRYIPGISAMAIVFRLRDIGTGFASGTAILCHPANHGRTDIENFELRYHDRFYIAPCDEDGFVSIYVKEVSGNEDPVIEIEAFGYIDRGLADYIKYEPVMSASMPQSRAVLDDVVPSANLEPQRVVYVHNDLSTDWSTEKGALLNVHTGTPEWSMFVVTAPLFKHYSDAPMQVHRNGEGLGTLFTYTRFGGSTLYYDIEDDFDGYSLLVRQIPYQEYPTANYGSAISEINRNDYGTVSTPEYDNDFLMFTYPMTIDYSLPGNSNKDRFNEDRSNLEVEVTEPVHMLHFGYKIRYTYAVGTGYPKEWSVTFNAGGVVKAAIPNLPPVAGKVKTPAIAGAPVPVARYVFDNYFTVADWTPVPIDLNDVNLFMSGGSANTDMENSTGGGKSTTSIDTGAYPLYAQAGEGESARGEKYYRCIYLTNNTAGVAAGMGIFAQPVNDTFGSIRMALGVSYIDGQEPVEMDFTILGWGYANSPASALAIPTLQPGESIALWIEVDVQSGDKPADSIVAQLQLMQRA
ncbi:MAG: hypothetical protein LPH21_12960 [Shewanella sp.]|nr:hypothetical protein [Shewanella sp.]